MKRKYHLSKEKELLIRREIRRMNRNSRTGESRKNIQHGTTSVYEHSVRVTYTSCFLAEKYHLPVDYKTLIHGAFLHDYFLYDWHDREHEHRRPHGFFHAGAALQNAKEDFSLTEKECNIIRRHMFPLTPCPPGCLEAWVVCAADKICSSGETLEGRTKRIVPVKGMRYSYLQMKKDLENLAGRYPRTAKLTVFGTTPDGRKLFCLRIGNPAAGRRVVMQAGMHGREWLNAQLFMRMAEECLAGYPSKQFQQKSYRELFQNCCFYLLPMTNPDGVQISQFGASGIRYRELRDTLKKMADGPFRRWKANVRGVDLNRNYPVCFGAAGKGGKAGPEEYPGPMPCSEEETKALSHLIEKVKPALVVNYHETGEVIYHRGESAAARTIGRLTGYPLEEEEGDGNGNLSDWLDALKIPWCTVETCRGTAPVPTGRLTGLWKKHRDIIPALAWEILQQERPTGSTGKTQ